MVPELQPFIIDRFLKASARTYNFDLYDKATGKITNTTVEEYFKKRYDISLAYPELCLVQTTKRGVVLPMECAMICDNQKYPFKLDEMQVRNSPPDLALAKC